MVDRKLFIQEPHHVVRLGLGYADDPPCEASIEEDTLDPGDRMHSNQRMNSFDRFPSHMLTGGACALCLFVARVDGGERLEVFLEVWRK